jgi:hypothetical protein
MPSGIGPQLAIVGAARGGTSSLASQLTVHPRIDGGKVKEPNYFSRAFDRGPQWYDGLYRPASPGLLRLDASVSYTSPLYPEALSRLRGAAPDVFVVYSVRDPVQRAVSHYLYRHTYFQIEPAPDFGSALRASTYYVDGSDYAHWLGQLGDTFPTAQLLVVPFEVLTGSGHEVAALICRCMGLEPPPTAEDKASRHRNDVVEFRTATARRTASVLRQSALYPRLRSAFGASRVRAVRGLFTRRPSLPSTAEALASCDAGQLAELRALRERSTNAVDAFLRDQDRRLGLSWAPRSFAAEGTATPS